MNRPTRAVAVAATSTAFAVALSFTAPAQAENVRYSIVSPTLDQASGTSALTSSLQSPLLDPAARVHRDAGAPALAGNGANEVVLDRIQVPVQMPAAAVTEKKSFFGNLWTKATALLGFGGQAAAPTLDQLVVAYSGEQTETPEQDCLAKAVYFEARGESLEGQLAVAQVVINRAASGRYPASLCGVVTQPRQFSFINRGKFPTPDMSSDAWRKAVAVSRVAQEKLAGTLAPDVLWYHASYVNPGWGKRLRRSAQIGLHVFYS
ncbi:cell wall hydrolase [Sphingosinicella sp. BN140058]|uniref:cell wall hydrolase n=1 Tax=Sphingosinicella sp. BN140058 TaxID=1892855 RepID=UPI00101236FC|nr:cell wall hydrolase [Sphingosinicella sp. BN140058]QAY78338.1 cell wall hydrolase [Sphingosinicella sp. BN140058]